jgi:glycosyltransferase involved in cell wall biosynthesis
VRFLFTTSFYPPYHVGGACTHVKYLAEALAEKGHEVHVLYSKDAYRFKRKGDRPKDRPGKVILHELNSPLGRMEPILNFTFGTQSHTYKAFAELIRRHRFDVVHHHNISLLGYDILKKIGDYRNIYTAHDYWLICHKYDYTVDHEVCWHKHSCLGCTIRHRFPYQIFRNSSSYRDALADIDLIITPSGFMSEVLAKRLPNRIINIPNLVPPFGMAKGAKGMKKTKREYFLFVGQLESHKGIIELAQVFKDMEQRLVIVGAGSKEGVLKEIAGKHPNIILAGWKGKEELAGLYAGAKALIVPSLWAENYPTVAIEAMQFGTPVLSTELGGTKEIVSMIDKKFVFSSSHFGSLKKMLAGFIPPDEKRVKRIYKSNFSPERYVQDYLATIR